VVLITRATMPAPMPRAALPRIPKTEPADNML
jgi:hypothetical protein